MADSRSHTAALAGIVERPRGGVEIDATDRAILRELCRDGRLSQRAIARAVDMSPPAVGERIARLERAGVIRSYAATVDWDRLGMDVLAFVPIVLESGRDVEPTLEALRGLAELEELVVLAGRYDLLARFRLRDQAHLRELLLDRLWQIPNIARIETMLALGSLVLAPLADWVLDEPAPSTD